MIAHWTIILSCLVVLLQAKTRVQRERRSTEFPSLKEIANNKPANARIQNSDCSFTLGDDNCLRQYTAEGTCAFSQVLSQLVPDVNMEENTNNFIVPAKFRISAFDVSKCHGSEGLVAFKGESVESVELAPQQLTMGAGTELRISWNYLKALTPDHLEVNLRGQTAIGTNSQVELLVKKAADGSDYTLEFKTGTLNVNNFLTHFRVEASELINPELSFASSRMGLATLIMLDAVVTGLFSPRGGFEIVATGEIAAPELPADASKFNLIIQSFKEESSDSADQSYGKPIAAIFALYKQRPRNVFTSLTGVNVPNMAMLKDVSEVAITAATKQIFNINSKILREHTDKYMPSEGTDVISKGLAVMHYLPNKNTDIKDQSQNTASHIIFRCQIENDQLTWTSPQRIETDVKSIGDLVWSIEGCAETIGIPFETKALFGGVTSKRQENQIELRFNLTERVPVLPNGLVSLVDSTITLFSRGRTEDECAWTIGGAGHETIFDELVDITITQLPARTTISTVADIFDMKTLISRIDVKPFNEEYERAFPFVSRCPLKGLHYEASFFKGNVLRFKGSTLLEGRSYVEIIYYMEKDQPRLKVGFIFKAQQLHKIINMFYGEERMKSTWIRFNEIAIVVKSEVAVKNVNFERDPLKRADRNLQTPGIGILAERLIVTSCKASGQAMCLFIKLHRNGAFDAEFTGRMTPEEVVMRARSTMGFQLGNGIEFGLSELHSHLTVSQGSDRLFFTATVHLTRTINLFPDGKIIEDGSNNIMLSFENDRDSYYRYLLGVNYAAMWPVKSNFGLPVRRKLDVIEFRSPLYIGTVEREKISLNRDTCRSYVSYPEDNGDPVVKFVGEKTKLKLNNLYHAFELPFRKEFLKRAIFLESVVFAYTSTDEEWSVPEFQVTVSKGLHAFGKLQLKTGEIYDATVNLLDNMQLQTVVHLMPLRYGKETQKSDGKTLYENINLFLYGSKEQSDSGPKLVVDVQTQYLKGYAETVGLAGPFTSEPLQRFGEKHLYKIKLNGHLYKEVNDVEVILTMEDKERPKDFKFTYEVDVTQQGQSNVNTKLREVLSDLQRHAKKGRDTAHKMAIDVNDLLDSYKKQRRGYLDEILSVQQQIHYINSNVDLAMIGITADCISQCRTVSIPSIEWVDDCLQSSNGQRNMKCMTWKEDAEKVINVICLLKCEAKKMAAVGDADRMLDEIRILVNRYRERKVVFENIGKLITLVEEADEIAKSAKDLVYSRTDLQSEIDELLAIPEGLIQLHNLKVDTDLEGIVPPCLPFDMAFTVNTKEPTFHVGVFKICFNGEFYKNVGLRIMKVKYPVVDKMYKALEEAELRYAQIGAIRKSLKVAEDEVHSSKRGQIPLPNEEDPVERLLLKIAKRRIPKFTLKGDKTVLAFRHYSPWATTRRANPFEVESKAVIPVKYNSSRIHGKSACHQTKEVIAQYKDIADNLQQLSKKYEHGKHLYNKTQSSISKDLTESLHEINRLINRTRLSYPEKKSMFYWYQYTERGMGHYLDMFKSNLDSQSEKNIFYLRNELASFYGMTNFVEHLGHVSSKAVSRSKIHGAKKKKQMLAISNIGKDLQSLLIGAVTPDKGSAAIQRVRDEVQSLYYSAASCY